MMKICCTKKMFDEIQMISEGGSEERDLFCWSAHMITLNRKKTVVVVNDSNRFGFILYGLKSKDIKHVDELILEGIKRSLIDEKIKPEVVEQYLQAAGNLVFTKTRGPKYVGRLNKACELVSYFDDKVDPNVLFQSELGQIINCDYIKISRESDYEHPYVLLIKDFESFAGDEVISCRSLDMMVKLDLGNTTALRRIMVPADITFRQLHEIMQVAFNWQDCHLYDFNILDEDENPILRVISDAEEEPGYGQKCETLLDMDVKLVDYAYRNRQIIYCYDYGDNWKHRINIMNIVEDYDKNYPVCLLGVGNTPPEDVGGIPGYMEFLNIMSDPDHPEYKTTKEWAISLGYREFDIDLINRRLASALR